MDIRIIKSPSPGTLEILSRRTGRNFHTDVLQCDAVGLLQGKMIQMIVAADIAEKAVGVDVIDIRGSCPQNMILLAIFGDTASVEAAIAEIRKQLSTTKAELC